MNGTYDPLLVTLSVMIAVFASYTALDLANSVTVARGRARIAWLTGGALAMGTGIWSMHFVGMLAFRVPGMPMAYDVPLLILSVVVAVAASALALWVISRRSVTLPSMLVASAALGAAIAGMHYIGIWSMRMPARIQWNRGLVAASILIAVGASFAALWLASRYRLDRSERAQWIRLGGGVAEGIAIAGMHYTAMAAAWFVPVADRMAIRSEDVLATSGLAVAVTGTTGLILAIAVSGSVIGRELARRRELAEENERLYLASQEVATELEFAIEALQARTEEAERLQEEAERTSERLRRLQSITDAALTHLDTDELLRELLARLCRVLSCDAAALLLRSADGAYLTVRAAQGLDGIDREARVPIGAGIAGRIAETGEPVVVEDISRVEVLSPTLRERVHSLIGVPLVVEQQVIGVLHAGTREAHAFSAEDLELLSLVGDRSAYALERARLYEAALEANRAKSEFLASMSHELRTPINAVMGFAELIEMGVAGAVTERQKAYLERIRVSNGHLLSLIEEVLDLSKIEAGRMEVGREHVSLWHVATEALGLVQPLARQKAIELTRDCARDAAPTFQGDPHRARQILVNLLSNAIKFTEDRGRITLRCGATTTPDPEARLPVGGEWAYVRVEDTGIGISPDQIERIFQPFVQIDGTLTRTRGGTGLGLTISRQFARLMRGDLTVRSEPGRGSCFTLWLPSARQPLDAADLAQWRGAAQTGGFAAAGAAMQEALTRIVDGVNRRLRSEPGVPRASGLSDAELEDHQATFLADIAQSLIILEQTGGEPELLREGSAMQRLIAERHGVQRARLGWTEEALRREFQILREEVERGVRASANVPQDGRLQHALELVHQLLAEAERVSLRGLRVSS